MDHKIKIKLGEVKIEYKGTESYLKTELPNLIDKILKLNKHVPALQKPASGDVQLPPPPANNNPLQMSSNSIAAKVGVSSGPDLIIVACLQLQLVQGKTTFKRKEISDEMKNATSYYKASHLKNLTASLKSLVSSNKLIERSNDVYAIEAGQLKSLKVKLNVQ